MAYLNKNSAYSDWWVIDGIEPTVLTSFVVRDPYKTIWFTPATETCDIPVQVDLNSNEIATSSKETIDDLLLRINNTINIQGMSFIADVNSKIQSLLDVININATTFIATMDNINAVIYKGELTDINIVDAMDLTLDTVNQEFIADEVNVTVFTLQNDANGNYIKFDYPFVTASGHYVTAESDINLDDLTVNCNYFGVELKHVEKLSSGIKVYFQTKNIHFVAKDFDMSASYAQSFVATLTFHRLRNSNEKLSVIVPLVNQSTGQYTDHIVGA